MHADHTHTHTHTRTRTHTLTHSYTCTLTQSQNAHTHTLKQSQPHAYAYTHTHIHKLSSTTPPFSQDGFHPSNLGLLAKRNRTPHAVPCTPLAVMEMLLRSQVRVQGSSAVVIGRSDIVGVPVHTTTHCNTWQCTTTHNATHCKTP